MKKVIGNQRYEAIDIVKILCSFLIIATHCRPFCSLSDSVDFYFVNVLARIAVPFFFAATSFLLFRKIKFLDGKIVKSMENNTMFFHYWKRIILLYVIWSMIYLIYQIPNWHATGWWGSYVVKDYLFAFFMKGSFYHLWYMLALIYGAPILYLMLRYLGVKNTGIIACILYVIKVLNYGYTWLPIPGLAQISSVFEEFVGICDGLCVAIPMMMVGVVCCQSKGELQKISKYRLAGLMISVILLITEASLLHFTGMSTNKVSYVFMTLPTCFFFFLCIISINLNTEKHVHVCEQARNASTIIYCVHPLLLCLWNLCRFWSKISSLIQYLLLCATSLAFAAFVLLMENKTKMKFLRCLR